MSKSEGFRVSHVVKVEELAPGEKLEDYGITPSDVLETKDVTYSQGQKRQDLLKVWYLERVYGGDDDD